jgi:hypothetical protein
VYAFFKNLDRRWIFLAMLLAVALPILFALRFPEIPSPMVRGVFDAVENLPDGSVLLMAYDYDPPSEGELQPMAAAFVRHAAKKNHKLIFMTLWPNGPPLVQMNIDMLEREFPHYKYGRDYVNLGYRPGYEGVIKVIVSDLRKLYANDVHGNSVSNLELTRNMKNVQQVDLIVNVSAGYPGSKEWVQYAATPFNMQMVAGSTGVQAPGLYPYYPKQLHGILGAIKAAAEYEKTVIEAYPELEANPSAAEGLRRMGPQLVAHVLVMSLIVLGNVIYFVGRRRGDVR